MNWKLVLCAVVGALTLGVALVAGAEPAPIPPGTLLLVQQPGAAAQPAPMPQPPPQPQPQPQSNEGFASAPTTDTPPAESYTPKMFGDFIGPFSTQFITVRSSLFSSSDQLNQGNNVLVPLGTTIDALALRAPVVTSGGFKIAENESPRPEDRVFVTFNYYNVPVRIGPTTSSFTADSGLAAALNPPPPNPETDPPLRNTLQGTLAGVGQLATLNNIAASNVSVFRETIGFEKTFFDDRFSFGMRVPFVQVDHGVQVSPNGQSLDQFFPQTTESINSVSDPIGEGQMGDISLIFKYAVIDNRQTGSLLSTGLVVTVPTGGGIPTIDGTLYPTLIQPYLGYILASDRLYLHGFSSIVVPTDMRDVTIWFNDVGVGYNLYRGPANSLVSMVTPTVELHLNTPLTQRGSLNEPIGMADSLNLTGGVRFLLGNRTELGLGVGVPLFGVKPFDVEAQAQMNYHF